MLFPNLYQPIWGIEGLATWQESRVTDEGRVLAGDFRALLDRAAGARRFEPLDRVSGGNIDWPGGNGPYLYGAYFHEFLAERMARVDPRLTTRRPQIPYPDRVYRKSSAIARRIGKDFEGP